MEASEHGLTCGARFVAVCLETVVVAWLMWVSWCVFGGAGFFLVFFSIFFSSNAHGLLQYEAAYCLIYLSTSNVAVFSLSEKKASSYRGAYRVPLFNWSVCQYVYV